MNLLEFSVGKTGKLKVIIGQPALVIIDMQRDFLNPTFITDSPSLIPNTKKLLDAARVAKIPIIHTMECHRPGKVDMGSELYPGTGFAIGTEDGTNTLRRRNQRNSNYR